MKYKPTKAVVGAVVATIGTGFTAALAFAAPGSTAFIVLTILSAMLTTAGVAFGVYQTTNAPVDDVEPTTAQIENSHYKPGSGWSKGDAD